MARNNRNLLSGGETRTARTCLQVQDLTTVPDPDDYRLMTLCTSTTSGSPGLMFNSARIGMRRSPKASSCSCESHTWLTLRFPSCPKQIS